MESGDSSCFDLLLAALSWPVTVCKFSGFSRPCYRLAVVWRLWGIVSGIIWRLFHHQRSTYSMGFHSRGSWRIALLLLAHGLRRASYSISLSKLCNSGRDRALKASWTRPSTQGFC
jgi:hypothetical protein